MIIKERIEMMHSLNVVEEPLISMFTWLREVAKREIKVKLSDFKAVGIFGRMGKHFKDQKDFFQKCSNIVEKIYGSRLGNTQKCYLYSIIEISNNKIGHYKKLWKVYGNKWDMSNFILGPEVYIKLDERHYYLGLAEFKISDLRLALEIQHSNLHQNIIFTSAKSELLTKDYLLSLMETTIDENMRIEGCRFSDNTINFLRMLVENCSRGDVVFRMGDSGEEMELNLIFSEKMHTKLTF